jgi:hypothetical protein
MFITHVRGGGQALQREAMWLRMMVHCIDSACIMICIRTLGKPVGAMGLKQPLNCHQHTGHWSLWTQFSGDDENYDIMLLMLNVLRFYRCYCKIDLTGTSAVWQIYCCPHIAEHRIGTWITSAWFSLTTST